MLHIHTFAYHCVYGLVFQVHEMAVCASSRTPHQLDFDVTFSACEFLRVQQVVDCAGVVGDGVIKVLVFFVFYLEELEQIV